MPHKDKEAYNRYHKEYRLRTGCDKKRNLNRVLDKLGISKEDYQNLFDRQKGRCAICGCPEDPKRRFDTDHCHITGKVRGLLCASCNRGIGYLKDNPVIVESALNYLRIA